MKYSDLTLGTVEAVLNKLGGKEGVEEFLRGGMKLVPITNEVLIPRLPRKIDIKINRKFSPFSRLNSEITSIKISAPFLQLVASKANVVDAPARWSITSFETAQSASTEAIAKCFPRNYRFTESRLCATICNLIDNQMHGEVGPLDTNLDNLFFVDNYVVQVLWTQEGWFLHVFDATHRQSGVRVFCPA